MGTNVYIDGFNLYYGSVRNTQFKWLDLDRLCATLLRGQTINRIRYFTASVVGFQHDPQAPARQGVYIRALATIPNLTVHNDGWYAFNAILLPQFPLAYRNPERYPKRPPQLVQVQRMEEKRTDVDLATYLLVDCFLNDFDEAAVISNDSDLVLPIEMVKSKFEKRIGVINPHPPDKMSGHLKRAASYHYRTINKTVLAKCQFPPTLTDAEGRSITKPPSW